MGDILRFCIDHSIIITPYPDFLSFSMPVLQFNLILKKKDIRLDPEKALKYLKESFFLSIEDLKMGNFE